MSELKPGGNPIFFFSIVMVLWATGVSAEPTIRIYTENWRPYSYEENGRIAGLNTEMVRKIMARAGFPYSISLVPWVRAYRQTQDSPNTMIYTIMRIPARESLFRWVAPLGPSDNVCFYRKAGRSDVAVGSLEDVKKYRTVVIRGGMASHFLEDRGFLEGTHWTSLNQAQQMIQMVLEERADLMIFNDRTMQRTLDNAGVSAGEVEKVFPAFRSVPYMAFGLKTDPRVVERIRGAYDGLVEEGGIPGFE